METCEWGVAGNYLAQLQQIIYKGTTSCSCLHTPTLKLHPGTHPLHQGKYPPHHTITRGHTHHIKITRSHLRGHTHHATPSHSRPHLAKVCWVAHHVDVEQLGHIPGPSIIVVSLEGRPYVRTLLADEVSLILGSLTGPNTTDQVTHTLCCRHGSEGGRSDGSWKWVCVRSGTVTAREG